MSGQRVEFGAVFVEFHGVELVQTGQVVTAVAFFTITSATADADPQYQPTPRCS